MTTRPCGHPVRHNLRGTPIWNSWRACRQRCSNPRHGSYQWYGLEGVEVRFCCIHAFYLSLGPRPDDSFTVDRIDPYGHYEDGNVRWASLETQAANKRDRPYHCERHIVQQHLAYAECLNAGT